MDREQLKKRTKTFAVRVVRMTESLPRTRAADIVARQVIRFATSVSANYRANRYLYSFRLHCSSKS